MDKEKVKVEVKEILKEKVELHINSEKDKSIPDLSREIVREVSRKYDI